MSRVRFEANLYRVDIEQNRASVQKRKLLGDTTWEEAWSHPYTLPVTHLDLVNLESPLALAVQTYELATGKFDLRDALTRPHARGQSDPGRVF